MHSLVASGRIVDLILLFMLLELAVLLVYRRLTGRGLKPLDLGLLLLPGLFLLLALRPVSPAALGPRFSLGLARHCSRTSPISPGECGLHGRTGASSPLDRTPCAPKLKGLRDVWESCP